MNEDIKQALFTVESMRITSQVQHACGLAAGLDDPEEGFNVVIGILEHCAEEARKYRESVEISEVISDDQN
jgi:hypothetical protein